MKLLKILSYPLLAVFLLLNSYRFYETILWAWKVYAIFKWLALGILAYFILRFVFKKNETWLQTQTHEWTHVFVALLFGHKIHYSYAQEGSGEMSHSGRFGSIFILLAPYCLPIFTYFFLFLRLLSAHEQLFIFDIIIGFTLAFHLVCFKKQTGFHQTDIIRTGKFISVLFIASFLLFNLTIVLLSIKKGVYEAMIYQFVHLWRDLVELWNWIL
jgi:hypothetical protein